MMENRRIWEKEEMEGEVERWRNRRMKTEK